MTEICLQRNYLLEFPEPLGKLEVSISLFSKTTYNNLTVFKRFGLHPNIRGISYPVEYAYSGVWSPLAIFYLQS
jgi:hypothetical protein